MKRNDLQAIRGIAILLVLLFHLQPKHFSLGFVGVDMFFVLSGYLMTMILSKHSFSLNQLKDFYWRRFRRIVPLMYLTFLGVYIGCSFLLFGADKKQLKIDLKWGLAFISNIQPIFEEFDYWDQVVSYRFLAHCWSLGVELQFYLIAPFLIHSTNCLPSRYRALILLLISGLSLSFQVLSDGKLAFSLLPSRIWQFLWGSLCFKPEYQTYSRVPAEKEALIDNLEKDSSLKEDSSIINRISEVLMACTILCIFLNPVQLHEQAMRIMATIVVAILIEFPPIESESVFMNRFLCFIGDISYVLYLIHWPIIVATKYTWSEDLSPIISAELFCFLILLATIFHKIIEEPILNLPFSFGFILSVICLSFILATFPFFDQCCSLKYQKSQGNINITEAIEYNERVTNVVYFNLPCTRDSVTEVWTKYKEEPQLRCQSEGHGKAKIMVIGNSMAYRAFPLISQVLAGRYKELRLYSRSARPPLTNYDPPFTNATHIVVDRIRPDILWNIHVMGDRYKAPFDEKNKRNDTAYLEIEANINYYKEKTKLLLIDLPFYWAPMVVGYELAKRLRQGKPIEDLKEMQKQQMYHRERILAVACSNCFYLDVESRMVEHGFYWFYNRENLHAYSKDGCHFTWEMLNRLEGLYKGAVDSALKKLDL